jgi:hypothetical protein
MISSISDQISADLFEYDPFYLHEVVNTYASLVADK